MSASATSDPQRTDVADLADLIFIRDADGRWAVSGVSHMRVIGRRRVLFRDGDGHRQPRAALWGG